MLHKIQLSGIACCLFLLVTTAYSKSRQPIIISIGESCTGAIILRELGLRNEAYPFDWTISEFDSLFMSFSDRFHHFFDPQTLMVIEDNSAVIDYYGCIFRHDLPTTRHNFERDDGNLPDEGALCENWRQYVPNAYAKYRRRVERLQKALSGKHKVYFLRYAGITAQSAVKLRDLIRTQYPKLDFTLVAIGHGPEFVTDWKLKRIKNFYLPYPAEWKNLDQWRPFFEELGLI